MPVAHLPKPRISAAALKRAVSEPRWSAYGFAGNDEVSTLACYMWSVAVHSALQPAVHLLEVTLRNRISDRSLEIVDTARLRFQTLDSWLDATPSLLLEKHQNEVQAAKKRVMDRRREPTVGCVIAELNFGFWTGLFDSQYEHGRLTGPRLWRKLATTAFPYLERDARSRSFLSREFHKLRILRNRIAHHEPIWKYGVLSCFEQFCRALGWMNQSAVLTLRFTTCSRIELLDAAGPDLFREQADVLLGGS